MRDIEQGLTSHQTHYRSYRGRVFTGQMTQPTVKALKEEEREDACEPGMKSVIYDCLVSEMSLTTTGGHSVERRIPPSRHTD